MTMHYANCIWQRNQPTHIKVLEYPALYYKHSMPSTCFGHSCYHPQGALQRIYYVYFNIMRERDHLEDPGVDGRIIVR